MKILKTNLVIAMAAIFILTSCSQRLIDFTVISSKNTNMRVDKSKGKVTEGKSLGFIGIGVSIKDAMDNALSNAGPQYDMLIDGVVRYKWYPFVNGYTVDGTAISSDDLQAQLGEEEYQKWLETHDVFDPQTAEVLPEE